jgi:hypothetical protein
MNSTQCQRLESAWATIRDYRQAIEKLEHDLLMLDSATDLRFYNTGNCEGTISIEGKSPLFADVRDAAKRLIHQRISALRNRIDHFPAGYVEHGDAPAAKE